MKHLLIAAVLALAFYSSPHPASASPFTVAWGSAPDQLGLVNIPEQERQGPLTFCVTPKDTLVVADTVNACLKEFSADGRLLRTFAAGERPSAVAMNARGEFLLLADRTVRVFDQAGALRSTLTVPDETGLVEGYAQEVFEEDGMVGVNAPDETVFLFAGGSDAPTTAAAVRHGRRAGSGVRAATRVVDGRPQPATAREHPGRTEGDAPPAFEARALSAAHPQTVALGGVIYRGMVGERTVWETEEIAPAAVRLFLRTPDKPEPLLELPNDYFTTVYRKFDVRPDGTVWQMRTTPDGVAFTRLEVAR